MMWDVDLWREMERLRRDMDGLFGNWSRATGATTYPLLNVYDRSDAVVATAELPGLSKDQVNIAFSDGVLVFTGSRKPLASTKDMALVRQERSQGAFEKALRIPTKVDPNGIAASFTNGILTVTLPKAEEAKPRTIKVEAK